MAVKYVKDFEFPSDKGFTGSAGQTMVRGYARGGKVCAKAGGGAVGKGAGQISDREVATIAQQNRMTRNAQRAPEDSVRDVRATAVKGAGQISDREKALLARNAKLGLKGGGAVKGKRNPQKIGSQEPVIKKGLGGIVKTLGGGLLGNPTSALGLGLLGAQLLGKKKDDKDDGAPQVKTAKDAYAARGINVG